MQKKSNPFPIAAVFFLLNLVGSIFRTYPIRRMIRNIFWRMRAYQIGDYFNMTGTRVNFAWVLTFLCLIVLCIALFIKRRNAFLVVAIALQCLVSLCGWGGNLLSIIRNIEHFEPKYDMLYLLIHTLDLCAMLVAVFMAIANIQKKSGPSKLAGIVNKLWFLPGVLYFTSELVWDVYWGVYYSCLFGWGSAYVRTGVVSNIVTPIVPTVAWLMLGLWFKQCWKAEVAEAQDAYTPVYISEAPIYEEPVYVAPVPIAPAHVEVAPVAPAPAAAPQKTTDELREYKQLLDDGVITQEEFDAKKKQLLGL